MRGGNDSCKICLLLELNEGCGCGVKKVWMETEAT